jgi:hypothetical protein
VLEEARAFFETAASQPLWMTDASSKIPVVARGAEGKSRTTH